MDIDGLPDPGSSFHLRVTTKVQTTIVSINALQIKILFLCRYNIKLFVYCIIIRVYLQHFRIKVSVEYIIFFDFSDVIRK